MAMLPTFSTVAMIGILLLVVLWLTRKWLAGRSSSKSTTVEIPTRRWLLKQAQQACRANNDMPGHWITCISGWATMAIIDPTSSQCKLSRSAMLS
jgi:hypothetical protein